MQEDLLPMRHISDKVDNLDAKNAGKKYSYLHLSFRNAGSAISSHLDILLDAEYLSKIIKPHIT